MALRRWGALRHSGSPLARGQRKRHPERGLLGQRTVPRARVAWLLAGHLHSDRIPLSDPEEALAVWGQGEGLEQAGEPWGRAGGHSRDGSQARIAVMSPASQDGKAGARMRTPREQRRHQGWSLFQASSLPGGGCSLSP